VITMRAPAGGLWGWFWGLVGLDQAEEQSLLGCLFAITNGERLVDAHRLVADRGDGKAHFGSELVVGLALASIPRTISSWSWLRRLEAQFLESVGRIEPPIPGC
jgi:hypothetical protein